ncbi:MAG: hypothetical protein BMS9Abin30_1317 [Gammaproteobacteria bacterium]|nr:MAG: hypothetical protein BMS9Abin30_1317 [Gammaproteobacteria bacterium]
MKRNTLLLIYVLAGLALLAAGIPTATAQVDKNTLWRDAVVTNLDVDFTGTGFHARWQYYRTPSGGMLVKVEQSAPDGILTGELLLVDGQVLLSRGFEGQGTDITPLMQAPLLMLQLANALLNRSEPKGPDAVSTKQAWDVEEESKHFDLNTGFATGRFAAPWRVTGSGWKAGSGHRRFELSFEFANPLSEKPDETGSITFSGNLDFNQQGFPYPETTNLDGWRIQRFAIGEDESDLVTNGLTLKSLREETNGS